MGQAPDSGFDVEFAGDLDQLHRRRYELIRRYRQRTEGEPAAFDAALHAHRH